jgi:hypothetical protein
MAILIVLVVLIVDLGIALAFLGAVSLLRPLRFLGIRSRGRAALLLGLGVGVLLLGLLLPPPREERVVQSTSLLDDWMPRYEFVERHEIRINASRESVERAILEVQTREIRLFRTLVWLRNPRLPGSREPVSILNPEADRPILEAAVRGGFLQLERKSGEEVVLGAVILAREKPVTPWTPAAFRALDAPGYVKATINFRIHPEGLERPEAKGWCRLTTETRVHATDLRSRRRFAAYWRLIYPGSSAIRVFWLRAIRDRAERTPATASVGVPF